MFDVKDNDVAETIQTAETATTTTMKLTFGSSKAALRPHAAPVGIPFNWPSAFFSKCSTDSDFLIKGKTHTLIISAQK